MRKLGHQKVRWLQFNLAVYLFSAKLNKLECLAAWDLEPEEVYFLVPFTNSVILESYLTSVDLRFFTYHMGENNNSHCIWLPWGYFFLPYFHPLHESVQVRDCLKPHSTVLNKRELLFFIWATHDSRLGLEGWCHMPLGFLCCIYGSSGIIKNTETAWKC